MYLHSLFFAIRLYSRLEKMCLEKGPLTCVGVQTDSSLFKKQHLQYSEVM